MRDRIGIRACTDADLPFVLSVLNAEIARSPYVYAESPLTIDERRIWLATHRALELPILLAVDEAGKPMGWGSLSQYRASSGYRFTVEVSIYVAEEARRRGVAARLLEALESDAVGTGKHVCVASIDSENLSSVKLFERFGYREAARLNEVGRKFDEWRTQLLFSKMLA